jgi:hypothetical protein
MLLSANDSSILQSTTDIFTTFDFGNTVCSPLQKHGQWMFVVSWLQTVLPKSKVVNMFVVDCKIEESLADNNININVYVYVIVS